ncbi:MAG: 2-oxo acid dehydrogenase subunit E2, partial [Solirubrobacterales bacterium]
MAASTTTGQTIDVVTPAAGESVTEGTILEWHVKVGDHIKLDDTIVEISTDKVDVELPSPAGGTVCELLVEEGETVTVGQVIARILVQAEGSDGTSPAASPTADGVASKTLATDGTAALEGVRISPVAARAAAAEGVDLAHVSGSGPAGRIVKVDVLRASAGNGGMGAPPPAAAPTAPSSAQPSAGAAAACGPPSAAGAELMKGGGAALARYMEQSLSIPTATSFRTLAVTALDARRRELKAAGRKVSFTHLIAYAIARAAQDMPVMAEHFAELDGRPHRVRDGQVNLGLAVDVEKKDGSRTLMVPVIRDAARMPFERFLAAYDALVEKARTNTLTADDLVGANITLTNPGGLGTAASVPRLMNGQGTIVATGSIGFPPGLANIGAMIGAEKVMTMTSTYDHRVIQGAESGRFLGRIEEYLRGELGFYDGVFASLGVELGPVPPLPAGGW